MSNFKNPGRNFDQDLAMATKGQLISKGNFGVFNSFKNELEKLNFCPSLSTCAENSRSFWKN